MSVVADDGGTGVLAAAMAAMVGADLDVADALAHLVAGCADVLAAGAVAVMVDDGRGGLALLAATSHRAAELEMLQGATGTGPCAEVIGTGRHLAVCGAESIAARWGDVGRAVVEAGFDSVEAYPMRWRGRVLGGLNVFGADVDPGSPGAGAGAGAGDAPGRATGRATDRGTGGQVFADVATLLVVQSGLALSLADVQERMGGALAARDVVEQAKGVLAHTRDIDMEAAYIELLRLCDASPDSLTRVAEDVVRTRGR